MNNKFFSKFNISVDNKRILEGDGYFVDTRYIFGFQVRWLETDMKYFLDLVESNKKSAKLKVSDEFIKQYKLSAFGL